MSTRDELIADLSREEHAPMSDHDPRDGSCRSCPWPIYMLGPDDIADALIAEGWRKKPSREEMARAIFRLQYHSMHWLDARELEKNDYRSRADQILALMDRGQ